MDRLPRAHGPTRLLIGLLSVVLVAALAACGGPREISLTELAVNGDHYDGQAVVATGVVREFGGGDSATQRHYVLQDAEANRVQLLPPETAAPHAGSAVEVLGEFAFDDERGRRLHIDTIEAVQAAP